MTKAQEMLELADLIEEGEGLMLMRSCKETPLPFQIGIKRTAIVIAALRLAAQADVPGGQPQRSPVAYRWRMRSAIDPSYVSYWSFGAEHPKIPEGLPCDIEPLYADTRPVQTKGE
jgi:hypothetical protein